MPAFSLLPIAFTAAAAVVPVSAQQEPGPPPPGRVLSLDNELLLADDGPLVITTASKKSQRIGDAPAAVSVITDEDIRLSGATSIPDLLRLVPGVDVVEPNRSQSNVAIRGFNQAFANKLLVMVDGRSIYKDFYGTVFWNSEPLLLSQIKRIEIVRGPGSALYGANAFSGVINIITKTPTELAAATAQSKQPRALALVGDQNSVVSEAVFSGGNANNLAVAVGAGYRRTDGFGGRRPGAVRDSYETPALSVDAAQRLGRGLVRLSSANTSARADTTALFRFNDTAVRINNVTLGYNEDAAASGGGNGDAVRNPVSARVFVSGYRSRGASGENIRALTADAEAQQQRDLPGGHSLVYGASYRLSRIESPMIGRGEAAAATNGAERREQRLWGLYAQDEWRVAPETTVFVGLRWDDNSRYGGALSPRLSAVRRLPHAQTLRLSYGTAFRAPTLLDSYFDFPYAFVPGLAQRLIGNPSLRPETLRSWEAGYRKSLRPGASGSNSGADDYVGVSAFVNQVEDQIVFAPRAFFPSPPLPPGIASEVTAINGPGARAVGLEIESALGIARGVRGQFNYAYQNAASDDGGQQSLSPSHKFNAALSADLGRGWSGYLACHVVGNTVYQEPFGRQRLPVSGYTRLDARLGYRFGANGGQQQRAWSVSVAATNLLGDGHREFPEVLAPGAPAQSAPHQRTFWLSVTGGF